ncbi:SdpI family protein [Tenacibaculum sp. IB213877]|uniref:SdpI family protein n=1 Tax=Tenacibaculum sp. IB213877 TaxID=3097351 RepID=UPI002A5A9DA1|nr:SdpI family protein [Tenacibaculum sp. IB213877]MDY0780513.1 SdpI family protein [Tenacibaculum sp. IB213877]
MNPYYYVLSVNGLLFIFSLIFYFFPPKKINYLYGYRTSRTMKNEDIWKFANTVFTKQFLIYSAISLIAALALAYINPKVTWQPMAILLLSLAVSVIKTEQAINVHFDKDGERK